MKFRISFLYSTNRRWIVSMLVELMGSLLIGNHFKRGRRLALTPLSVEATRYYTLHGSFNRLSIIPERVEARNLPKMTP